MPLRITRSIIPNLFTLGNLFSGFLAIIHCAHGLSDSSHVVMGAFYILAAAIFDMLDGMVARFTRAASELGVELDSLCDVVSFGVAPSVLLYTVYYRDHGPGGLLLAALPAMAGAYRLARFNVQLTSLEDKQYFRGLPIPAGALTLVSFSIFYLHWGSLPAGWVALATNFVTVMTTLAMISTIRYDNVPRPTLRFFKQRPVYSATFVVAVGAVVVSAGKLAFPVMMLYIVHGAIRHGVWLLRQRQRERFAFDDFDD